MTNNIYSALQDMQTPGLEYIYAGIFGHKTDGLFVEVGAHDGRSWSNTAFLADLGWKGLYIEPMEHLAKLCAENHKNNDVIVEQAAVGTGATITMLHDNSTSFFYSGNEDFGRKHGATEKIGQFTTVKLDSILEKHNIQQMFDLLVVDVEGMEVDVLRGFSLTLWMPKLVVIETHELDPNAEIPERTQFVDNYFHIRKYNKIYTSAINAMFMRL